MWGEISELDVYALNRKMKEESWSEELVEKIKEFQNIEKTKRIYLSKIKKNRDEWSLGILGSKLKNQKDKSDYDRR